MAVLYWKPCYNEARYKEVGLYKYYFEPHITSSIARAAQAPALNSGSLSSNPSTYTTMALSLFSFFRWIRFKYETENKEWHLCKSRSDYERVYIHEESQEILL